MTGCKKNPNTEFKRVKDMTKQEYLERIKKINQKIIKIEKRIEKRGKDLTEEDREMASRPHCSLEIKEEFENYCISKGHTRFHRNHSNIYELNNAFYDKRKALETLHKYQMKLQEIENFENGDKIEALVIFLNTWADRTFNWYLENAKTYFELMKNHKENEKEHMRVWDEKHPAPEEDNEAFSHYKISRMKAEELFNLYYYAKINEFTKSLTSLKGEYVFDKGCGMEYKYTSYIVDEEELKKFIEQEKTRKYKSLIERITKVVGVIQNADNLSISYSNGEINGYVLGDKATARVETISAGGYNIQCFHYRVLAHKVNSVNKEE